MFQTKFFTLHFLHKLGGLKNIKICTLHFFHKLGGLKNIRSAKVFRYFLLINGVEFLKKASVIYPFLHASIGTDTFRAEVGIFKWKVEFHGMEWNLMERFLVELIKISQNSIRDYTSMNPKFHFHSFSIQFHF